jgi:hypothetical protein
MSIWDSASARVILGVIGDDNLVVSDRVAKQRVKIVEHQPSAGVFLKQLSRRIVPGDICVGPNAELLLVRARFDFADKAVLALGE